MFVHSAEASSKFVKDVSDKKTNEQNHILD